MDALLKKLNYKGQSPCVLFNLPEELKDLGRYLQTLTAVADSLEKVVNPQFALFFVTQLAEIEAIAEVLKANLEGDPIFWFIYPKGSSKRYQCNFNRDTGWAALGKLGMEPVRMVAVNEDWSALRMRRVEYIKNFTRNEGMILSEAGREKKNKG